MIALRHSDAPFGKVALCDLAVENVRALEARTAAFRSRVKIVQGDVNCHVRTLIRHLPERGLNLALVDPFGLQPLCFDTLAALAALPRMDLIINVPTMDIRRNQHVYLAPGDERVARMLGEPRWRDALSTGDIALQIWNMLVGRLAGLGYTGKRTRTVSITNRVHGEVYRLAFASKHALGDRIWNAITTHGAGGQRGFGFS